MKKDKLLRILCIILAIFIVIIILLLLSINNKATFKKPEFDKNVREIPSELDYEDSVLSIVDGYSLYISPNPKIVDDNYLKIDLVSIKNNRVFIKVRILDENKEILGETGLLRAGEYLEKVKLNKNVNINDKIIYKIMGYEKDTYMSAGSISLNTRIGG